MHTRVFDKGHKLNLHDTLLVPDIKERLMSIPKLDSLGYSVIFKNATVTIADSKGTLVATGEKRDSMFYLSVFHKERHASQR